MAKIIVFCEKSGKVRRALAALGIDAWSNDVLPADDKSPNHIQCDARELLSGDWDGFIAHPECRYLSVSGMHWNGRVPGRAALTEQAVEFAGLFFNSTIPLRMIENPVSILSTRFRKPDQIIQPYQFGHDASKATCLWLNGVPTLQPTEYVAPRIVDGRKRWSNQTDSGQNRLGPSETRSADRAQTYDGIAGALALAMKGAIDGPR